MSTFEQTMLTQASYQTQCLAFIALKMATTDVENVFLQDAAEALNDALRDIIKAAS